MARGANAARRLAWPVPPSLRGSGRQKWLWMYTEWLAIVEDSGVSVMRILFLTGQVPYPPHAGGAMRTYGLLDGLHHAGHHIDLLTFTEADQPDPGTTPLAELCEQIITAPAPRRSVGARLRDVLL